MVETKKNVQDFAFIAFTLLGILFGMMIMSFIFGQLGNSNIQNIADVSSTVTNLSNLSSTPPYINETGFIIPEASFGNFSGGFSVVEAANTTSGQVILAGNYTVNSGEGSITNATTTVWELVNLTYTWNAKTSLKISTEGIQNNSLQAIVVYTNQSDTQMSTVAIAITLVILISVFLIFWNIFVTRKKEKGKESGGNFG